MSESYKTISKPSDVFLFKEKKSKFLGHAFPISSKESFNREIQKLKVQYSNANHFCYAWRIGIDQPTFITNDDGEPNNTAGVPIYGQIQSFELTNIAVVVVCIFGGVKLGTGGLMSSYKAAAKGALTQSNIITTTVKEYYTISFPYAKMHAVIRMINEEKAQILSQDIDNNCNVKVATSKTNASRFEEKLSEARFCSFEKDQTKN